MSRHHPILTTICVAALLLLFAPLSSEAITKSLTYNGSKLTTSKNTVTTVAQHSAAQTLTTPIDYVITAEEGTTAISASLDIAHEQAAVIFRNARPSYVLANYLRFITIGGKAASDGANCRVETYRHGTIILPYGNNSHPLTVFKSTNATGESRNDFGVNTYYTSLGDWDNAINSFTLKRGYMVTMANHTDGTGYSHCFIANDGDITVTLPQDMRNSVSFLRIFRWRYPSKKGYAGRTDTPMSLMRVTWFYQWNSDNYQLANYDYVPQRHHENGKTYTGTPTYEWPGWNTLNNEVSAHVLGVNEPDNTSGSEMYMPVSDLITHHADYLRSGMRIGTFATCNPNVSWVKAYIDSCEAHNYRVDFVATHYYIGGQTPQNCINSLKSLYDATGLPVWCTEWNNGANWTNETSFYTDSLGSWYSWGSGNDQKMNGIWLRDVLKRADASDNTGWLERMAVYNNVQEKRFVHWQGDDFWTTPGGELYGSYRSDFAYHKSTDVWMNWRSLGGPQNLNGGYSMDGSTINLMWREPNTDWTKTIYVQQNTQGSQWVSRAILGTSDEEGRSTSIEVSKCTGNKIFRICSVDANGTTQYSNTLNLTDAGDMKGYTELTSMPSHLEDYYFTIMSKDAPGNLCWTLTDAAPTSNYTSRVGTSKDDWQGASGTTTGNGIALVELYNSASSGIKMQQTIGQLPNGIYTAVLYATSHNARGEDGATLNGTRTGHSYVFATASGVTKKTYFTASGVTPGFLSGEPYECVLSDIRVTNGSLTLGLGLENANVTGWHCIQIKSLTRTGDIPGIETGDTGIKAVAYADISAFGTDATQVWQIEANPGGEGYTLRSPSFYDDVLTSPSAALFQTDGTTHTGSASSGYQLIFDSSANCWRMKSSRHGTYCGVGTTPTAGAQLSADRTQSAADKLKLYAVKKIDFNQVYIVDERHHDANYTLHNPNFSWGISIGQPSGSGRVEYPVGWTFNKTFDGWNDVFCGTSTMSDGTQGTYCNAWAGTFKYAELMQEVTNLPNGVYQLSADFATTSGYSRTTSRTALYGNAGSGNISRAYNIIGKGDNTFVPYTCYVLVKDHRMTVGARSDGTWFKVGHFALNYVCSEEEATDEILGYLDNGRALQHQCWLMDEPWVDLSAYPHCRDLQIDQTAPNALVKMASTATVDATYNDHNIIIGDQCTHLVVVDEAPLTVASPFTAKLLTYERTDDVSTWHELFVPFAIPSTAAQNIRSIKAINGSNLVTRQAKANEPNVPAIIQFKDSRISLQQVEVSATKAYDENTLHGLYTNGGKVKPLRWYADDNLTLSDFTILLLGDVNRDGQISISDVMDTVGIIMGQDSTPPFLYDHQAADINIDGDISIADVMLLINIITHN